MQENIFHTYSFNLEFSINQSTLVSQGNYIRYASVSWNAANYVVKSALSDLQHLTAE